MAKGRLRTGRWVVASVLLGFVIAAAAVVARRSYGFREGLQVTAIQRRKANLESERVRLDQAIRDASSRQKLLPVAERMGMHLPSEAQVVILGGPRRSRGQQ